MTEIAPGSSPVTPSVKAAKTTKLPSPFAPEEHSSTSPQAKDQLRTGLAGILPSEYSLPIQEAIGTRHVAPTKQSAPSVALSREDLRGLQQVKHAFRHDPATLAQINALEQSLSASEQAGLWSRLGGQIPPDLSGVMALLGIPDLSFLVPRKTMPTGKDLVETILQDLANPDAIYQGMATTTCTAASLQSILARTQPAEYTRLAVDLATKGTATLKDGSTIQTTPADFKVDEGREALDDAFQEAFMRRGLAAPPGRNDRGVDGTARTARRTAFAGTRSLASRRSLAGNSGGMTVDQYNALFKAVTGQARVTISPEGMWDRLVKLDKQALAGITVMLKPENGASSGHAVTLQGFEKKDAETIVRFHDPELPGKGQEMKLADFENKVEFLAVDPALASQSKAMMKGARPLEDAARSWVTGLLTGLFEQMVGKKSAPFT